MYAIFFCDDDGNTAGLPDLTPRESSVVRELAYAPGAGDGENASEEIRLGLEGTPGAIETFLSDLERALGRAEREAGIPGGDQVYLACQLDAGTEAWRAKLLGGRVILAPGSADQRTRGGQRCTLAIRRADAWETLADPALLLMQNRLGNNGGRWLEISNHADAEHSNLVDLPAMNGPVENVRGDLPAPAALVIGLPDPGWTDPLTFFVGASHRKNVEQLSPAYAGESGTARGGALGTPGADANCAGGQYLRLDWSGAQEQELWGVDIPSADAQILAGYPVLPLLRLQQATSEALWYRWRIYAFKDGPEYRCDESSGQALEADSPLLCGPALHLPPWLVDQTYLYPVPDLRLVLSAQGTGSGAHSLSIDSLSLMGLEGWRIYRPLTSQASSGISDNGPRGTLYRYLEHTQSHAAEGPGLALPPGQAQRLTFLALSHAPGGDSVPAGLGMRVWVYHRPRKRRL